MVPFENFSMISYCIPEQLWPYLAVCTQYTNVTDTQPDTQALHDSKRHAMQSH